MQYDDNGQKQSQLSLHRGMGNDFLFHVQLIYNYVNSYYYLINIITTGVQCNPSVNCH